MGYVLMALGLAAMTGSAFSYFRFAQHEGFWLLAYVASWLILTMGMWMVLR